MMVTRPIERETGKSAEQLNLAPVWFEKPRALASGD